MAHSRRAPGRPAINPGDVVNVTYPVRLTGNTLDELKRRKESDGVPVATRIRRLVERGLNESPTSTPDTSEVPICGVACAGESGTITETAEHGFVRVPFSVPHGAKAVLVDGNSMVSLNERISVPSGSYVIFRAEEFPTPGVPVLALVRDERDEWRAMLKVYAGARDGFVTLEPRNPRNKTLTIPAADVRITGVYYRHWPEATAKSAKAQTQQQLLATVADERAELHSEVERISQRLEPHAQQSHKKNRPQAL